jgi:hypothetical protein
MNLIAVMNNLYTAKDSNWIRQINDTEVEPFVIQRWLVMNDKLRVQTRWLDKYVYSLPTKMFLSLAWSVIPKVERAPFIKYISKENKEQEYEFILGMMQKQFALSDNDLNAAKSRIIAAIKLDPTKWFSYYGINKRIWKQYNLNFNLIKTFEVVNKEKKQVGLSAWGL